MHSDNTVHDALRSAILLALGIVPAHDRNELVAALKDLTEEDQRAYKRKFRKLKRALKKDEICTNAFMRDHLHTMRIVNDIVYEFVKIIIGKKHGYRNYYDVLKRSYPRTHAIVKRTVDEMCREKQT